MENLALNTERINKRKFVNKRRMRHIAQKAVDRINYQVDFDDLVENLSVADKQLIAICRALLFDARLIIMDEPTSTLTKREVVALFDVIHQLKDEGIAILFVSHKMDEVFEIAERFTILRNGKNVITANTDELEHDLFTKYLTGRDTSSMKLDKTRQRGSIVLETRNLSLPGSFVNESFTAYEGEVLGITGLLGSGRTELAEAIFGILPAESGQILIDGKEVKINNVNDAIAAGIGYLPEDRLTEGLFAYKSITDNLSVSKLDHFLKFGPFLDDITIDEDVQLWVKNLSIDTDDTDRAVFTLSGGNQQKVVLARWLALDLRLLILNSPTAGVDVGAKYDIHQIVCNLAREGLSVIVISDDMPEVIQLCDRVLIMRRGHLVEEVRVEDTDAQDLTARAMKDERGNMYD